MSKIWTYLFRKKKKTGYDNLSPNDDTQLFRIGTPDLERTRLKKSDRDGLTRLQRNKRIRKEDLIGVISGPTNLMEDEVIPGKAIVLKMPERSIKSYFIPLPVDLDGLKRRATELFGLSDEVDLFSRLEFELFAYGIVPSSASLPLLKDREVVYVNLLPPRPPTPFSLTLAPARAENSLVAEVRRPGTGLPYEVVYTAAPTAGEYQGQHPLADGEEGISENVEEVELGGQSTKRKGKKRSRFKEHMSMSSRRTGSLIGGEVDKGEGKERGSSPNKVWYKEDGAETSGEGTSGQEDPFRE